MDCGAAPDGRTDSSGAFDRAVSLANDLRMRGIRACIYVPPGNYKIASAFRPFSAGNPGCVIGDGPHQSKLVLDAGFSGDLFAWTEAWANNYDQQEGLTTSDKAGPYVKSIGVYGDRTAKNIQNGFVFYDRNDYVVMEDVSVYWIHGRAWYAGAPKLTAFGFMRESDFRNLRFEHVGTRSLPAMEIDSKGSGDSTNQLVFHNLNIFDAGSTALLLHNSTNDKKGTINIRFFGLRLEKAAGDLLAIGAPTDAGRSTRDISIQGYIGNDSPRDFASIRVTGPDASRAPYNISIEGTITSGSGYGIVVDAGRNLEFSMLGIATAQTGVKVASSKTVGPSIHFNGNGHEERLSYEIDPSALKRFSVEGIRRFGDPSAFVSGQSSVAP